MVKICHWLGNSNPLVSLLFRLSENLAITNIKTLDLIECFWYQKLCKQIKKKKTWHCSQTNFTLRFLKHYDT